MKRYLFVFKDFSELEYRTGNLEETLQYLYENMDYRLKKSKVK